MAFVYNLRQEASPKHPSPSCWVTVGKSFVHLLSLTGPSVTLALEQHRSTPAFHGGLTLSSPLGALHGPLGPAVWVEPETQTGLVTALCSPGHGDWLKDGHVTQVEPMRCKGARQGPSERGGARFWTGSKLAEDLGGGAAWGG